MMNKFLKAISIFLLILVAGGLIFLIFRFMVTKKRAEVLATRSEELFKEKVALTVEKNEEEALITVLKKELASLSEVKNIKEQYEENEKKLQTLDASFTQVKKEKDSLQESNLSLNNRVNSLTREFTKTLDTLKEVKQELNDAKSDKTIRGYQDKIDKTDKLLQAKVSEIKNLVQENANSNKEKKILEKKIVKLEKDVEKAESKLAQALKVSAQSPNDKLKAQIADLRSQVQEKEAQRHQLNGDVVRLSAERAKFDQKLNQQSDKIASLEQELLDIQKKTRNIKKIEDEKAQAEQDLADAQKKLKEQEKIIDAFKKQANPDIVSAQGEIPLKTDAMTPDLNRAYALYDTAKAQVVKFSELLMSKEVELETSKQRISDLEKALSSGSQSVLPQGATEAQQYTLLKDRIKMLNDSLSEKEEALKKKNEELASLAKEKETLEQHGVYQDTEFKNANMLYSNLKTQMLQTTELLSRREEDLIAKNKDILSLKSELAILKAEFNVKQQELADLQERQKRTMEDLSRSTKLNIDLQENMVDRFKKPADDSEDKIKADKLKKEIELLMSK
jgi:chromosome segregation protein